MGRVVGRSGVSPSIDEGTAGPPEAQATDEGRSASHAPRGSHAGLERLAKDEGPAVLRRDLRFEIRLAGDVARHGLLFAGVVLAEAAVLFEGRQALQSQVFGPSPSGKAGRSDVILSDADIESPKLLRVDALAALTQEALEQYGAGLREGGLLVCDAGPAGGLGRRLPLLSASADPRETGLAALGAIVALLPVVSADSLDAALAARVEGPDLARLRAALERGRELALAAKAS